MAERKRINSVAAALTVTLSSTIFVIAILCLNYSTESMPTTRMELPIPLNVDRKDLLKDLGSSADFGYFSSDPSTRAYSEISRALGNAIANSTSFSEASDTIKSQNTTLKSGDPIHEVSVFDRVSNSKYSPDFCFINHEDSFYSNN